MTIKTGRIRRKFDEALQDRIVCDNMLLMSISALNYESLKYAVINRILKNNPCETVTRPKKEKAEHDFYNADEIKSLIQYSKNDPLEVVVYLAVLLGLRREEVLGLRWENVDFNKHTIRICETVVRAKQGGKLVSVAEKKTKTDRN